MALCLIDKPKYLIPTKTRVFFEKLFAVENLDIQESIKNLTATTMKLSFRIHKNIDLVFGYLTDMQKFVSVHPVISQIDNIGNMSYLVHETLKFGFIPFSFTYPVSIEKCETNKTAIFQATVFKLTKITMSFSLKVVNDYTIIDEEIHFKSSMPVKFIMESIFKKQHEQLFKNIEMK